MNEAKRGVLFLVFAMLPACGDNNFDSSGTGDDGRVDATPDGAPDAPDADPCPSDSVRVIQPGNPGSDQSAYPAAGWWSDDTRANGTVAVDAMIPPPAGFGCRSARLTTGATTDSPSADKAQLISFQLAGTNLSSINTISYWAYRSSASTGGPAIALALNVSVTGSSVPGNYASLVYEPYHQSTGNAGVMVDVWQEWNATATTIGDGLWWTSKIPNGNGSPGAPGSQANPQPWSTFQILWPDAKIAGYGFNVGSFNPNMIVAGDGLVFGTTTTDF